MPIFITLSADIEVCNGEGQLEKATIPIGKHEMERIPNPLGYPNPWLVLKGTKIGQAETTWRKRRPEPNEEQSRPQREEVDQDGISVTIEET